MTMFFKLTGELIDELVASDLTAAEWRIWVYLVKIDSFGDRYQEFEPLEIIEKCRVSKATMYRAFAKLQEHELFDFQATKFNTRNLKAVSSRKNETEDNKNESEGDKNESDSTKMRRDLQECDNRTPKPALVKRCVSPQTIQTYSDIKDTTDCAAGAEPGGSVFEIFEKYREPLQKIGVYVKTYQNEMIQLNPKVEPIIQQAGCLPINQVEPAIKAFIAWARTAKDVKDIYRAFKSAIKNRWEES